MGQTIFILLLLTAAASAQEAPTFRARVSLVRVDVQVTEGKKALGGLGREDFEVLDEGVPRKIVYFGNETEPLWVMLLLDVSGSTRKHVKEMAEASREALRALASGDHAAIMVFGRHTDYRRPFTGDLASIERALLGSVNARGLGSGTRINAAIIDAANQMREAAGTEPGRRAIVIMTDNKGLSYKVPNEDVLRALYDADAVLNAIAVGGAKPPKPLPPGANPDFTPPDIFLLARETGGEVIRANKTGAAFKTMLDGIRTRYSLHYHAPPAEPGIFRRIEARLTPEARRRHRKATIRARAGYYTR